MNNSTKQEQDGKADQFQKQWSAAYAACPKLLLFAFACDHLEKVHGIIGDYEQLAYLEQIGIEYRSKKELNKILKDNE